MRLIFNRTFKSINRFESIELPDFTVLTGVNGAGKSHLLEAIENGSIMIEGVPQNQLHGERPIRRFDSNTLVPQDTGAFSSAQISQEQSGFWNEIIQHRNQLNPFDNLRKQFGIPALEALKNKELVALSIEELCGFGIAPDRANQIYESISNTAKSIEENVKSMFIRNDPQNRTKLISNISSSTKLPIFAMEEDDFFEVFPNLWQPVDLFQQSFARLFSAYQRQWSLNKLKEVGNSQGADVEFLSESEFVAKHGVAPWNFLNEILGVAELDFRINEPYKWDDRPYEPILTDIKREVKVKFNDLSSGERILMSFALCLYHANDPKSGAEFPQVILFDEIDAPLHPSMTKSLLRTIQTILVKKHQIKVILATHSPSTVALSPDDAIFVMSKQGHDRLRMTSKDAALSILTAGVPTLSVNYENRRQVFVESKYDVQYYSSLYEIAKAQLDPEISLSFIASGSSGNGDCVQVKNVVEKLTQGGNKTVVGIIDWDTCNASTSTVLVLGETERYSIENFLLDPVLIGFLLLREKWQSPDFFGLDTTVRYTDLTNLTEPQLQSISDCVVSSASSLRPANGSDELVKFTYSKGLGVYVPEWFSLIQGHALETRLKEVFPQFLRYRNEPDLKMAILDRVLDDLPHFVPESILTLFKRIQNLGLIAHTL